MNIRKKGKWANGEDKYVLEDNRKYIKTLPPADELNRILCLDIAASPIKETKNEETPKTSETFAQSLLREQQKQDAKPKDEMQEIQNELKKLGVI